MANENLTTTTQLDSEIEFFYDRVLLENARAMFLFGLFGVRKNIPPKSSMTMKFRRAGTLSAATTPLTEGQPPNPDILSKTDIMVTLSQYGAVVHITDLCDLTIINGPFTIAAEEQSIQMMTTVDNLTRDVLLAGASVTTCSNGDGPVTLLNETDIDSVVNTLMGNNASKITKLVVAGMGQATQPVQASFWAIGHTDLRAPLKNVSGFVATKNYANQGTVHEAEYGATDEVRWLLSTEADTLTGGQSASHYEVPIIAKNAYATINLGSGNAKNIRKPFGFNDALNQIAASGWKLVYGARILNDLFIHILRCTAIAT